MNREVRKKHVFISIILLFQMGCSNEGNKITTPEMEQQARESVAQYLKHKGLPIENLKKFNSKASPKPDFGFLYTGGGRCIELIVNCYESICTEVHSYPYDEHGEQCP